MVKACWHQAVRVPAGTALRTTNPTICLDLAHGLVGNCPRPVRRRPAGRHPPMRGSAMSRCISVLIGASFSTANSARAGLNTENSLPPNSASTVFLLYIGQRRINANQIVRLRTFLQFIYRFQASGAGSVLALRIFFAIVSASSVRTIRERSDGSDFDIFFEPSRRDMTRVAGPSMIGSVIGKYASP